MTTLNIQAAQNDIIRQVLNTQDIHLLDRIRNLFANKLKSYREGKLELKPLEDVLNEL